MFHQFTESMRCVLRELLQLQLPIKQIAERLGVNRSSVYRELARNTGPLGYIPVEAQQRADARRSQFCRRKRKMDNAATHQYVCRRLKQCWSPDQIAGRAKCKATEAPQPLSRQTIYNWIARLRPEERKQFRACLRFGKPRRPPAENSGRLPGAVSIEGRPKVVDRRLRFGDWEGDTIVGAGRRGGWVSLVERRSGFTLLERVGDLRATTVRAAIEGKLRPLPIHLRRSATFDNGKEFAEHQALGLATGMAIYFAQPYCAWQRGTNENTNGLVRQYVPKGTDLAAKSHHAVAAIEVSLNDRPRKRLGYRTPREVLNQNCAHHGVALGV